MRGRMKGLLAALAMVCVLGVVRVSAQEVEFNYNGRVKVNGQMFSGHGQFKFALVSKDGEATFWTNDGLTTSTSMPTATVTVDVSDGFFSVNIGDAELPGMAVLTKDVFARDEDMYLRVWFNDGTRGFEMLTPDRKITNTDLLGLKISKIKDYTIYVNGATGNDKHLGLTPAKPKKTIQGAIDTLPAQLKCNVTIDIADGVYREQVNTIGINAMPGKKLMLLGDESWTPAFPGNPAVRVTGSNDDVTSVPVRANALYAEQSSGLRFEGLLVDYCTERGVNLDSCSSCEIIKCKIADVSRPTKNGYGVFATRVSRLVVENCLATRNDIGFNSDSSWVKFNSDTSNDNNVGGFAGTNCIYELRGCKANFNRKNAAFAFGLQVRSHSEVNCYDYNEFTDNATHGIFLNAGSFITFETSTGGLIANNICGMLLDFDCFSSGHGSYTFSGNTADRVAYHGSAYYN